MKNAMKKHLTRTGKFVYWYVRSEGKWKAASVNDETTIVASEYHKEELLFKLQCIVEGTNPY